ncbi:hypothetical protein AU509_12005 [Lonsdalea britannica]|uniref:Uncharacterized protein n=1 Tax=Lonsdalea britannica TaxID=1082704 RepID=A0AAD0WLH6_9GAMM|nr:hypothetical protein CKQ53_13020 [Lonsdalea britannica]OSM95924.1 hypothetical protein AU509_12005 [Lonsdalea britannica]
MTYFFMVMVLSSQSMNMQIAPMESMEQCQAAIKATEVASDQRSWSETSPRVNNIKCVEVER